MNQTVNSTCSLQTGVFVTTYIIWPLISFLGIVFNLFTSIVFIQIMRNVHVRCQMFKYLLIKSLNDLMQFNFHLFSIVYYCPGCETSRSHAAIVWYIGFFYYGESVVELTSAWLEILATIDCYCFITSNCRFLNSKTLANVLILLLHICATFFYIYIFFSYEIVKENDSHKFVLTKFSSSSMRRILGYLHTSLRDLLVLFLLAVLNLLIYRKSRINSRRKQKLIARHQQAVKIKNQHIKMIFLIGLNYFCGHLGYVFYYMPVQFQVEPDFWNCFWLFNLVPFYISYMTNIFIYFGFNKHFRHYSLHNIKYLFNKICLYITIIFISKKN